MHFISLSISMSNGFVVGFSSSLMLVVIAVEEKMSEQDSSP